MAYGDHIFVIYSFIDKFLKKKKVNSFGGAVRQILNGEGLQGDIEMLHNEMDRLEAEVGGKGFGVKKTAGLVLGNYRK